MSSDFILFFCAKQSQSNSYLTPLTAVINSEKNLGIHIAICTNRHFKEKSQVYLWSVIVNTSYCQLCRSPKTIHFDMCGHVCEFVD